MVLLEEEGGEEQNRKSLRTFFLAVPSATHSPRP